MKVVIQKCNNANVIIDKKVYNSINKGLCILVGFTYDDDIKKINYMINKIVNLRIFEDEYGVMNKSIIDINGEILSISNFTLYGDTRKGNRPSYINALKSSESVVLYDIFNKKINKIIKTKTGIFGSNMKVNLENDGPTTIVIDY